MQLVMTTPPDDLADDLLRLACDHLRRNVVTDDESPPATTWPADIDYIRQCLITALSHVDGPRTTIRRALLEQSWTLFLDEFPTVVAIPLSPVMSITSIKYLDADGDQQTMDPLLYRMSGAHSWQPEISPAYNETWPATRSVKDAIEIQFVAGFSDDWHDIPSPILQAILEFTAHLYSERQPIVFGSPYELPLGVKALLAPYKIYR